eukprot:scaffold7029_cov66-Phaeocystis_antarctica.AAC.9
MGVRWVRLLSVSVWSRAATAPTTDTRRPESSLPRRTDLLDRERVPQRMACKHCTRACARGSQRNGRPWRTCCKGCGLHRGEHDPECDALQPHTAEQASPPPAAPSAAAAPAAASDSSGKRTRDEDAATVASTPTRTRTRCRLRLLLRPRLPPPKMRVSL